MCCSRPQLGVWRTVCPRATRGKRPRYLPIGYQNYEIVCRRPYRVECTGSLSTSEVKQHRARLVLGWGTAWEDLRVLSAFYPLAAHDPSLRRPARPRLAAGTFGHVLPHACAAHGRARESCARSLRTAHNFADGHTVSNAPDLFRPPKLSGTGPG